MVDSDLQQTRPSPAQPLESLRLKTGDDVIHYLKSGTGPPVLLLHGGACESSDWVETMTALSDRFTFYAPDLVGYGLSDRNKAGYLLSDFVDSMLVFMETLGIESCDIVGHSLGGRIAVEIALRNTQKVRKLVLIDAAGFSRLALWGSFLASLAWAARGALRRPQPYPRFLIGNGENPHWLCLDKLSALQNDTLIIWNRRDPYYSVAGAFKAQKIMPRSELKVFPGYGHAPHRSQRELFNSLLLEFLSRD
jgi:pimeloyl-ACP methyl ester carboxylesterase